MSATTATALKAYLEAAGVGVTVYRDAAPQGATLPYITVSEGISVTAEQAFSQFDDADGHVIELAQVDVWQRWRDSHGDVIENYVLPDKTVSLLRAARLSTAPTRVAGVRFVDSVRLLEREANVIHHALTIAVHRVLVRS